MTRHLITVAPMVRASIASLILLVLGATSLFAQFASILDANRMMPNEPCMQRRQQVI